MTAVKAAPKAEPARGTVGTETFRRAVDLRTKPASLLADFVYHLRQRQGEGWGIEEVGPIRQTFRGIDVQIRWKKR